MTDGAPLVDVIIPVHTPARPVARAAASILDHTAAPVRVTIVCHGVEPARIATALGELAGDPRVRLLHHVDGVPSPAGPINAGLDAATAPFTSLLGSDDRYAPGAVDAWLQRQARDDADVVIPRVLLGDGRSLRTPPVRPFRTRRLDGVRDRLAYRSVQLGLVSRARFGGVRMTEGLRTGEDIVQGMAIWFSDARISFAATAPGYLISQDGDDRVTVARRPAAEILSFLDAVLAPDAVASLTPAQRSAFAVKLLRTNLWEAVAATLLAGAVGPVVGEPADLSALSDGARRILALDPRSIRVLARSDAALVRALADAPSDRQRVMAAAGARAADPLRRRLLPDSLGAVLHREAPLRFLVGSALSR